MTCEIISSGSSGNAVNLGGVLLDCGVPFKSLRGCAKELKLVLLTHRHSDHFRPSTVSKLAYERPTLRFGCCAWMVPLLRDAGVEARRIDVYGPGAWYEYGGGILVSPFLTFHDVENCGYRVYIDGEKSFYATDTVTLNGISAKNYDLYLVEANYTEHGLEDRMSRKLESGEFSYEARARDTHMSREYALKWLSENAGENSKYSLIHQHEGD